ncbi:MAG: response regulator [Desulfobacteraceae bacterium]|nr:MAG: response regulator [Desulfobacteraceae bacterium]
MPMDRANVLVIDDEEMVRNSCAKVLTGEGHAVRSAATGDQGLSAFKESRPDLVLIDLKMPGKSGMEVLEELQGEDPDVVKIVITGYATVSSAVDAMRRGAYDFIPKPFSPDELVLIVTRGLEKRRLLLEKKALAAGQEKIRRNMVSLVSHELRAPIAATVQYLEIILEGMAGEVSAEAKDLIRRSDERLREMLEMIGKWINLAVFDPRKMAERFEKVNLKEIALKAMENLEGSAAGKKVKISLEVRKNLPSITGSKVCLEEVFNNLIGNAVKYNREKGRVVVRIYEKEDDVCFEVADNGIGIEKENLPRIFDEFYRVDGRRNTPVQGSGLGLAIVKTMVDAHGGLIEVDSQFGKGTSFKVFLPKVKGGPL